MYFNPIHLNNTELYALEICVKAVVGAYCVLFSVRAL